MAEQKLFKLTITKVDEPVFDGEVELVTVPGVEGEMTLLAEHEAIISPLQSGVVTWKTSDGSVENCEISSGTLEFSANQATVLVTK